MAGIDPEDPAGELRTFDTCLLSDALDRTGVAGAVLALAPRGPAHRIAGRIHTVHLEDADLPRPTAPPDEKPRHLGTAAIEVCLPGEIILVAHHDRTDAAGWGGLLARAAACRGVAGVVVDGVCRDGDDYVEHSLPVWSSGLLPRSARGRVREAATDVPITVGGVVVHPGDWLVADRSGVVVIPAGALPVVLAAARHLAAVEAAMTADLVAGKAATEVLGARYERLTHTP